MKKDNSIKHLRRLIILLVLLNSFTIFKGNSNIPNKIFYAGAATSNITPPLGKAIVGELNNPPAEYIHDELHARCLVLDDSHTKLVFVVLDVVAITQHFSETARKMIEEKTKIPSTNIIISATHTHSAASASGEVANRNRWGNAAMDQYQEFIISRISDVVQIALKNSQPARIAWGVTKVPQYVHVRRWKMKEPVINPFGDYDRVVMNPGIRNSNKLEPASKPDPDVTFISVQSVATNKPIAILANYSLHYVGGIPEGHISANYFGMFADQLEKLLDARDQTPRFVGIMSNGTSGDVNSVNYGGEVEDFEPYQKAEIIASEIAKKVVEANSSIKYQDWVPLAVASESLLLRLRKPSDQMIRRAMGVLDGSVISSPQHSREKDYARRTLRLLESPESINIPITTFSIGQLGVASLPFEVLSEIGFEIKEKSPFPTTFTIELANGSYGYLPNMKQHELGGYETWLGVNNVQKDAADIIIAKITDMLVKLKK